MEPCSLIAFPPPAVNPGCLVRKHLSGIFELPFFTMLFGNLWAIPKPLIFPPRELLVFPPLPLVQAVPQPSGCSRFLLNTDRFLLFCFVRESVGFCHPLPAGAGCPSLRKTPARRFFFDSHVFASLGLYGCPKSRAIAQASERFAGRCS